MFGRHNDYFLCSALYHPCPCRKPGPYLLISAYDKMVKIYFNLILARITEAFPYEIVPKYLIRVKSLSIIRNQPFL